MTQFVPDTQVSDRGERFRLLKRTAPGLLADLLESMSDEALLTFVDELPNSGEIPVDPLDAAMLTLDTISLAVVNQQSSQDRSIDWWATDVTSQVHAYVDRGEASDALLASWQDYLTTHTSMPASRDTRSHMLVAGISLPAPDRVRQLLDAVEIKQVASLGSDIAAVAFFGSGSTRLVLGQDAIFDDPEDLEAAFLAYRLYLSTFASFAPGDLPQLDGGCRVVYKQDSPLRRLCYADSQGHQDWIDDAATTLLFPEYADDQELGQYRSLLRAALARPTVDLPLLRDILSEPILLRREVQQIYQKAMTYHRIAGIVTALKPRLRFVEPGAVVRELESGSIYFIWKDPHGVRRRRWIPSRKVALALGMDLARLQAVDRTELKQYDYNGILLDPNQVRQVRAWLENAVRVIPLIPPRRRRGQLVGLNKAASMLVLTSPTGRASCRRASRAVRPRRVPRQPRGRSRGWQSLRGARSSSVSRSDYDHAWFPDGSFPVGATCDWPLRPNNQVLQ